MRRALEATYDYYTQSECCWSEPIPDPRFGKVPVYVCDLQQLLQTDDPFTAVDGEFTFLGLRSELAEPTHSAVLERQLGSKQPMKHPMRLPIGIAASMIRSSKVGAGLTKRRPCSPNGGRLRLHPKATHSASILLCTG